MTAQFARTRGLLLGHSPRLERAMNGKMGSEITRVEEAASFEGFGAIAATLQTYIDAARAGDGRVMSAAFLETAYIRGAYDGKPVDR